MLTIVIARYNEDISWVNDVPPYAKVYLYNKGPSIEPGVIRREVNLIPLPNEGRESGTYMYHLMHGFNPQEAEFTVFTQGDPFDHSPNFIKLLDVPHRWQDIQPLSLMWMEKEQIPPVTILKEERNDWIGNMPVRMEFFGLKTWAPISFYDEGAWRIGHVYFNRHSLPIGTNIAAHFFQLCGLAELADKAITADLGVFSYGGIFAIRNNKIAAFLNTAKQCLNKMETLTRTGNNYGYIFERCWLHFFGEPFVSFKAIKETSRPIIKW